MAGTCARIGTTVICVWPLAVVSAHSADIDKAKPVATARTRRVRWRPVDTNSRLVAMGPSYTKGLLIHSAYITFFYSVTRHHSSFGMPPAKALRAKVPLALLNSG